MAIDTTNEKFSVITFGRTTDPAVIPPVSTGFPTEAHKWQLLWQFAGLVTVAVVAALEEIYYSINHWHRRA